jgi:ADP-ribosyl-[dinitrogen reductase] hydrolase
MKLPFFSRSSPKGPLSDRERAEGCLLGLVTGDALGVPVEFLPRERLRAKPVTEMVGFGTHNQPAGTWSDDSSLALATAESLIEKGYDPANMMERFRRWLLERYMRPHGELFDVGFGTREAIMRYAADRDDAIAEGRAVEFVEWGGRLDRHNGNGSLMRIAPLAIFCRKLAPEEIIRRSFEVSGLTHAHIRSKLCCACFCLIVRGVFDGLDLPKAMDFAWRHLGAHVPSSEEKVLGQLLAGLVLDRSEEQIESGGYVVHTLEAALWVCHGSASLEEAVLRAVNLGGDSDTTGAVAGALAGLLWGREAIPAAWVEALARRDDVVRLVETLAESR